MTTVALKDLPCHDSECLLLIAEERETFLKVAMEIARIAVAENFGKLPVQYVEIYNSLADKNEAKFVEWVGGANA